VRAIIRPLFGAADLGLAQAAIRALELRPPIEQDGNRIRVGFVNDTSVLGRVSITYEIETPRDSRCRVSASSGGIQISGLAGPATVTSRSGRIDVESVAQDVVANNSSGSVVVRRSGGRVSANTTSGLVQVLDTRGPVDLQTTSGRTEVTDVIGYVKARTNSGSIIVNGVSAGVHAVNRSGSIDAHGVAGEVNVRTRSGAIRISQVKPAAITARTDDGAIKVDLAHGGGYDLDAQSEKGRVSGLIPDGAGRVVQPRRVRGQIRGGGPLVDLDTRSSNSAVMPSSA
jgi:DUF4097 and DUF4098 domain-containing protein YvlB